MRGSTLGLSGKQGLHDLEVAARVLAASFKVLGLDEMVVDETMMNGTINTMITSQEREEFCS